MRIIYAEGLAELFQRVADDLESTIYPYSDGPISRNEVQLEIAKALEKVADALRDYPHD